MPEQADKSKRNKYQSVATDVSHESSDSKPAFHFIDKRPEATAQRKLQALANKSPRVEPLITFQANRNRTATSLSTQFRSEPFVQSHVNQLIGTKQASQPHSTTIQRMVDKGLVEGTQVRILTGSKRGQQTTIVKEEVRKAGYTVRTAGSGTKFYSYRELDLAIEAHDAIDVHEPEIIEHVEDDRENGAVQGPPEEVLQELVDIADAAHHPVEVHHDIEPQVGPHEQDVTPFPNNIPNMELWDTQRSFHDKSDQVTKPFRERWNSNEVPPGINRDISLDDAITYLEANKRFFSHELPQQFLPFAIAQGSVQSGYNTTKALGHDRAKHDVGKAQHKFVFTRQLPPSGMRSTLSDGQVGAAADAMIVFKPSMFSQQNQPALFKNFDGGFRSHTLPSKAYKGGHIQHASDQIELSKDKTFHANQEQGTYGSVGLNHIAIIVLKADTETQEELAAIKDQFIAKLRATSITSQLPPKEIRAAIRRGEIAYREWQENHAQISLYDKLLEATGRDPENIIRVLPKTTRRSALRNIAHAATQQVEHHN